MIAGPSPRLRGSPDVAAMPLSETGSIPAPAGEPRRATGKSTCCTVHPRACGGAITVREAAILQSGPSPRLRGSRQLRRAERAVDRSIPAPAGEPYAGGLSRLGNAVHPRACGGAGYCAHGRPPERGPSPRLRGSHRGGARNPLREGSIPAPAGEPRPAGPGPHPAWVHPRACGGAHWRPPSPSHSRGPSPRLRGSPSRERPPACNNGSIPAPAGEPLSRRCRLTSPRVHPRACGGACQASTGKLASVGPSPRLRGSPAPPRTAATQAGSIPAPAGEPGRETAVPPSTAVHPRACGGAAVRLSPLSPFAGPSPRLRGSHKHIHLL